VIAFGAVSGLGLAIDFVVFLVLLNSGLRADIANFVSAGAGVAFVYFSSVRRIFAYEGRFLKLLFLFYLSYQIVAISLASWAVGALVSAHVLPILAKILILPATFSANYLFMSFITRSRQP
jgi:putative flippase GtrA